MTKQKQKTSKVYKTCQIRGIEFFVINKDLIIKGLLKYRVSQFLLTLRKFINKCNEMILNENLLNIKILMILSKYKY
jgi:hypothetical protein